MRRSWLLERSKTGLLRSTTAATSSTATKLATSPACFSRRNGSAEDNAKPRLPSRTSSTASRSLTVSSPRLRPVSIGDASPSNRSASLPTTNDSSFDPACCQLSRSTSASGAAGCSAAGRSVAHSAVTGVRGETSGELLGCQIASARVIGAPIPPASPSAPTDSATPSVAMMRFSPRVCLCNSLSPHVALSDMSRPALIRLSHSWPPCLQAAVASVYWAA
jgi:hypothetical protein